MVHAPSRRERIRAAIDRYQGRLIAYASRITGDIESGRDVVQDTFLRLCMEDLDDIADHLPAWLFRVCRNRAIDVRKKQMPLQPLNETNHQASNANGGDPHRALEGSDRTHRILAAVAELPVSQQEVLRLRFQEEFSYREISAITGHSVSNVGFLIHRGIKTVRRRLLGAESPSRTPREGARPDA